MSAVIEKVRPLISDEEKAKRKKTVDFAEGSSRLEGVILPPEIKALNQQYINGEINCVMELGEKVRAESRRINNLS